MLKTIIVDDEPLALDILENYIAQFPSLQLVARCNNALEANRVLMEQKIDLMFLDIQMPQMTGIEFLRSVSNPPKVVFTTAYPNFAVEGFELNAIDYLLKPISMERFMKAVNRVIDEDRIEKLATDNSHTQGSAAGNTEAEDDNFLFVKADKKLVKVYFKDVVYIEGLKDYVMIITDDARIVTLQTMKSLEDKLPSSIFKRIHRSFIVNVSKIEAIVGNAVEIVEKGKPKHLPVGKNYKEELDMIIEKNKL